MSIYHTHIKSDDKESISVIINAKPYFITSTHVHFNDVKELLTTIDNADEDMREGITQHIIDLITDKPVESLTTMVRKLTGNIEYDGEDISIQGNTITGPIVEVLRGMVEDDDGSANYVPLAKFLERLYKNPSRHSRNQLYTWIKNAGLSITNEGYFIAYKGLDSDGKSIYSGGAYINGQWVDGRVPNEEGTVISMPRRDIEDDPEQHCAPGLHVGHWDYAQKFGRNVFATCLVDPAHVVSVPNDCNAQKIRTSQYYVLDVSDKHESIRYNAGVAPVEDTGYSVEDSFNIETVDIFNNDDPMMDYRDVTDPHEPLRDPKTGRFVKRS